MQRLIKRLLLIAVLALLPTVSLAETRALLAACSDFITQNDLGSATSGNLHMIGSAFLGISPRLAGLSIEDGTIGTPEALERAVEDAFAEADEDDFSILYLCTHGVLSSDDHQTYLCLSDGDTESTVSGRQLCDMLAPVQGEKLLILDACYSGGLIGRSQGNIDGFPPSGSAFPSPFLQDPSISVLTSAGSHEASWYYDSDHLQTGAVSYFASALAAGMGLYGVPEADLNGDSLITLTEIHRYLNVAVPSSSSQLLSANADALTMPAVERPVLSRPLTGFTYGELLLSADDPVLEFSYTAGKHTGVQYRLIDYDDGRWDWENAKTFLDPGDDGSGLMAPGRKTRELALSNLSETESGYLMLQVFSLSGDTLTLCSERLLAVQGKSPHPQDEFTLLAPQRYAPGDAELAIGVKVGVPAEITVSVYSAEGEMIRRLAQSQLTRPAPGGVFSVYWDGCDASGYAVQAGEYTIAAEAVIDGQRVKAASNVIVVR